MPEDTRAPADDHERRLIHSVRGRNLFVDAGAGTGKTRSLVDRVEALVLEDGIAMESIAAITFTEKAAAELQNRIRRRFEQRLDAPGPGAQRARDALEQLDSAAVGTLHSFARRILGEHLLAAELPPGIEMLDEIGSQIDFESRWGEFLDDLLEDPDVRRSLLVLDATGVMPRHLRVLALQMAANWDLIESRMALDAPPPQPFDPAPLIAEFDAVLATREECERLGGDKLLAYFDKLASNRERLAAAIDDIDALMLAADMGEKGTLGIKPGQRGGKALAHVRQPLRDLCGLCDEAAGQSAGVALEHVGGRLGSFVLRSAEQRRLGGKLEFHDLLVRARRLLRDRDHGRPARKALHERYQRLLLDEFQDTDPIQIELAMLIASSREAGGLDWREIDPDPGRLFVVGDPKQSIYRFRRADIKTYLDTRERFGDDDRVDLTVNFRTTEPVISWVNDVFSELIVADEDHGQPAYMPLTAHRLGAAPTGPSVALLGVEPVEGKPPADELRQQEAAQVVACVADALYGPEPWSVYDAAAGDWRQARPDDVCILLPARTSLAALERALDDAAVPYRAETSSLVYASREVRELMLALTAVADPTNELATIAALRSFVYGCGDDDLAHWRHGVGGRFGLRAPVPEDAAGHPVADGLRHLRTLHEQRLWTGPAELLDRLIRERGVLESAVAGSDPRGVWRRLRFVVDQARAWTDAGGTDLRAYLKWARLQGADNARVTETVLPEVDDRSVRIMTVHSAKGLEFPITVLSGMTTRIQNPQRGPAVVFPPGSDEVLLKASGRVSSEGYDEWQPIDDQMDERERMRLLYVAATRARDHLVVSLVRKVDKWRTGASVLAGAALDIDDDGSVVGIPASSAAVDWQPSLPAVPPPDAPEIAEPPDRDAWHAERSRALAAAGEPRVVAASTLAGQVAEAARAAAAVESGGAAGADTAGGAVDAAAAAEPAQPADPGLAKGPRDLDLPPWKKGRYGTAVGRAVHGVLQSADLATGSGIDSLAKAQAMAEGIPKRERLIAELARQALTAPVAKAAAASQNWREIWVAAPLGDRLVEGYVDLMYRTPEGLVVVDWKTDQADDPADLEAKAERYRLQGASYAVAVEAATGETVNEMVFVFLAHDGAHEVRLGGLREAMDEVTERAAELAEMSATAQPDQDLELV